MKVYVLTQVCGEYDEETADSLSSLVRVKVSTNRQKLEDLKKVWYEETLRDLLVERAENSDTELEDIDSFTIEELMEYADEDFYEKDNFAGFVSGSYCIVEHSFDITESELD